MYDQPDDGLKKGRNM